MAGAGIKAGLVALFFLVLAVTTMSPQVEGITCGDVASKLAPWMNYLTDKGTLASYCCLGVKALNSMATTTPGRQTTCKCLKSVTGGINGINFSNVASLPGKCGVSIPYKINPSTDCSKIQ